MHDPSRHAPALAALLLIMLLLFLVLIWVQNLSAQHGHWTDRYSSASGMSCCGQRDCFPVHARLLGQTGEHATVEVNGTVLELPVRSVHTSEDMQDYLCTMGREDPITSATTRCLFLAVGG